MIFVILTGLALIVAIVIFLFTTLWYSKFLFGKIAMNSHINKDSKTCSKKANIAEFLSSFLLAIGVVIVFAPFNFYFGLINGGIIALTILLPMFISQYVWSDINIKQALVFALHRFFQVIIAFAIAGAVNSFIYPLIAEKFM
jgi:hypothetical protein